LVLGGALGWLIGVGALAVPGAGPFIAAGPIVAAVAGAGEGPEADYVPDLTEFLLSFWWLRLRPVPRRLALLHLFLLLILSLL